jgi:epoxyqueuosine reductase
MLENRREFLKSVGWVSGAFLCRPKGFSEGDAGPDAAPSLIDFQYRTVAIDHLAEMKSALGGLNRDGKVSQQKTIQSYLKDLEYQAPKEMPNARSLIVVATPWRLRLVGFRWRGKELALLIPGGYFYYENESFREPLRREVARRVVGAPGAKLVFANPPLKTLAVRSGLAEYGKNNIAYVDGYGSFHVLWAFYSDAVLVDQWTRPYRMMRICEGCSICIRGCPTQAIRESEFVVEAGRCITTYNEMKETLPSWIDAKAHNAFIGCLRCQNDCPVDRGLNQGYEHVADLTEAETALLLEERHDAKVEARITEKLKGLGDWYAKDMKYLSRNVRLALANSAGWGALQ